MSRKHKVAGNSSIDRRRPEIGLKPIVSANSKSRWTGANVRGCMGELCRETSYYVSNIALGVEELSFFLSFLGGEYPT